MQKWIEMDIGKQKNEQKREAPESGSDTSAFPSKRRRIEIQPAKRIEKGVSFALKSKRYLLGKFQKQN